MSVLKQEHRIEVESVPVAEALERVLSYYRLNGYEVVAEDLDSGSGSGRVLLTRGERGAGWYTSEMTGLFVELAVVVEGEEIVLRYEVDVKGQRLKGGDRAFWGLEAQGAEAAASEEGLAVDLRPAEAKRVAGELKRFYLNGAMFTVIFVVFILILIFLGIF